MYKNWTNIQGIGSRSYQCSCGDRVASEKGWHTAENPHWWIYICPSCAKPTFFDDYGVAIPGVCFGNKVSNISDQQIESLYEEARNSFSVNAFTNVVLACRKLLMHVAVSKGAPEGQNFTDYVQYLSDNHLIPVGADGWVDHIRTKGNEANHEIKIMTQTEAETILIFIEMLLKMIYEFPARLAPA